MTHPIDNLLAEIRSIKVQPRPYVVLNTIHKEYASEMLDNLQRMGGDLDYKWSDYLPEKVGDKSGVEKKLYAIVFPKGMRKFSLYSPISGTVLEDGGTPDAQMMFLTD
jgi:hypothetical protein